MNSCHNERSAYGLSWFCSPRPALVWIGVSGRAYPHSFELWPVINISGLSVEGKSLMKYFSFNEHYYSLDISLQWTKA